MKSIIVSGGTIEDGFALGFLEKEKTDYLIAADRGLAFFHRNNIHPDCIVGDFDSAGAELPQWYRTHTDIPVHSFRPEKDMTDTDIAVKEAIRAGASEIILLGCTGTRLDHVLSNIFNLRLLREQGILGRIVDQHNRITMPVGYSYRICREEQFGKYVSFFPCDGRVTGLTLRGFAYPLSGAELVQGDGGLTVSNEIAAEAAEACWESGSLLVIESRD